MKITVSNTEMSLRQFIKFMVRGTKVYWRISQSKVDMIKLHISMNKFHTKVIKDLTHQYKTLNMWVNERYNPIIQYWEEHPDSSKNFTDFSKSLQVLKELDDGLNNLFKQLEVSNGENSGNSEIRERH